MIPEEWYTFWVDGGAGPKRCQRAASAFVVYTFDHLVLGLQCIKNRNSTEAEWNAVLMALEYAFAKKMEQARIYTDVQHLPRPHRQTELGEISRTIKGHLDYQPRYKVEYKPHPDDVFHPGGIAHHAVRYAVRNIPIGPMQVFKIPKDSQRCFYRFLPNGFKWRIL